MADDPREEDTWLYGNPEANKDDESSAVDGNGAQESSAGQPNESAETTDKEKDQNSEAPNTEANAGDKADEEKGENGAEHYDEEDEDEDDDDDDDDDINVVIGDIKSGPSYNLKQRTNVLGAGGANATLDKKQAPGKFSIDEFECVGTISGIPAHEFSIDSLDEKPWRKPGADITDYFNYGFNEETWRSYCERQKQMRLNESGVGLQGLSASAGVGIPGPNTNRTLTPITSEAANTYTATTTSMGGLIRRAGPPPRQKLTGQIDVIGNGFMRNPPEGMPIRPIVAKENVIQVMTAERREYSRVQGKFDSSMPPPSFPINEPFFEPDNYNYGYEPTQEQQWNNDQPAWMPTGIKELTPGPPQMVPPPMNVMMRPPMAPQMVPPPHMGGGMGGGPRMMPPSHNMDNRDRDRDRERDRDRDRDRDRGIDRDRDRDRGDRDRVDRERERERDYRERSRDRGKSEERDRDRYRERSSRRETTRDRSRSRERRRRSKSRDKDRKSRDKKKSHKKDKEKDDSD